MSDLKDAALKAMRDPEIIVFARNFYKTITGIAESLVRFGVKSDMIAELDSATTTFETTKGERAGSSLEKSTAYEGIVSTTKSINILFKKSIDPLIESLKHDLPEYCAEYFASRTVHDHGVRHRKTTTKKKPINPDTPATDTTSVNPERPIDPEKPASE